MSLNIVIKSITTLFDIPFCFMQYLCKLLLFSHLADAFIQSDLEIRNIYKKYKLKL